MGTLIDLRVGNLIVDWGKNQLYRDHRSLFQKNNVQTNRLGEDAGGRNASIATLARPLREVIPRLRLLGYTLAGAREEYDSVLKLHRDEEENDLPSFDEFLEALRQVDVGSLSAEYEDDHDFGEFFREEIGPRIDVERLFQGRHSESWNFAYMMENFHPWLVLVLLGQIPRNLNLPVIWDYAEHLENGWSEAKDFVPELKPREQFIVVTEGSSDAKVIQKALSLLNPGVLDFFTFVDMQEGYPFSGSGELSRFCRGLMKIGIQNKAIVLFDNDAEGDSKFKALQGLSCPSTMKIIKLPDLPELRSVPGIGTSGRTCDDINGRAASIEAYLDLSWKSPRPALVRWTNYVKELGVYQGALESKEHYVRSFLDLRDDVGDYDMSKLHSVLADLLGAAGAIARANPAHSEY